MLAGEHFISLYNSLGTRIVRSDYGYQRQGHGKNLLLKSCDARLRDVFLLPDHTRQADYSSEMGRCNDLPDTVKTLGRRAPYNPRPRAYSGVYR